MQSFFASTGLPVNSITVIDAGTFPWSTSTRFPGFTEPSEGYHGLIYAKHFGATCFSAKVRMEVLKDLGACLSPLNAFLLLQGSKLEMYQTDHFGN